MHRKITRDAVLQPKGKKTEQRKSRRKHPIVNHIPVGAQYNIGIPQIQGQNRREQGPKQVPKRYIDPLATSGGWRGDAHSAPLLLRVELRPTPLPFSPDWRPRVGAL